MKKLLIGGAVAALVVAMAPAFAQSAPPPGVAPGTPPAPQVYKDTRIRVMTDKVMTRDEAVTHVRDLFARFDTNKDGYLTREEIDATRDKMIAMHGDIEKRLADHGVLMGDRGAVFEKLDANHDGNISRQEFMASKSQMREQRVIVMRDGAIGGTPGAPGAPGMRMHMRGMGGFGGHLFEMADSNKDGRVSLAEAQAAALAHFDKADLNHDGKITPEERQQMHQLRREQRRQS
jgi:Ca2+-binding EF-hand superfamily protein